MGKEKVIRSSGNVFADQAQALARLIRARGLTQKAAAGQVEIDPPKVSTYCVGTWPASRRIVLWAF